MLQWDYFSHISAIYVPNLAYISSIYHLYISVIWIWEKFENPDPPPSSQNSVHFELWTFWFSAFLLIWRKGLLVYLVYHVRVFFLFLYKLNLYFNFKFQVLWFAGSHGLLGMHRDFMNHFDYILSLLVYLVYHVKLDFFF